MSKRRKIPPRSLLCHGIGAALLTLSAGCVAGRPTGYLVDANGNPVHMLNQECLQVGPLDSKDKQSECYKRAHQVVHHHIEPLPRDEFAFMLPPEPKAKKPAVASTAKATPTTPPPLQFTTKTLHFTTPVRFKLNHAGLSRANRSAVLDFVNSLAQYRGVESIHVIGHTDLSGSRHFNQWLADNRAESVKLRLLSLGVDPRTLTVSGQVGGGRNVEIDIVVRVPVK